jgi:hypothetical protein
MEIKKRLEARQLRLDLHPLPSVVLTTPSARLLRSRGILQEPSPPRELKLIRKQSHYPSQPHQGASAQIFKGAAY